MVGKVLQGCGCHLLRGYVEHTIAYNFPRVLREPVDINHTILHAIYQRIRPCTLGLRVRQYLDALTITFCLE